MPSRIAETARASWNPAASFGAELAGRPQRERVRRARYRSARASGSGSIMGDAVVQELCYREPRRAPALRFASRCIE